MLFTLVVNLLLSCLMLLLGGWTCDALSKWKGAGGSRAIAETSFARGCEPPIIREDI